MILHSQLSLRKCKFPIEFGNKEKCSEDIFNIRELGLDVDNNINLAPENILNFMNDAADKSALKPEQEQK